MNPDNQTPALLFSLVRTGRPGTGARPGWLMQVVLDYGSATTQQVEDEHNRRDDQQQVNQTTADAADQA